MSIWGTGEDIAYSKPSQDHLDSLAARSSAFLRSLGARFDLVFAEFADRDAGQRQVVNHDGGASFWSAADFACHARCLADVSAGTGRPGPAASGWTSSVSGDVVLPLARWSSCSGCADRAVPGQ